MTHKRIPPAYERRVGGWTRDELLRGLGIDGLTREECLRGLFGDLFEESPTEQKPREDGEYKIVQLGPGRRHG